LKKNGFQKMNQYGKEGRPFLFIIDFEKNNVEIFLEENIKKSNLFFDIDGLTNYDYSQKISLPTENVWEKTPVDFELYQKAFGIVQHGLHRGDSFLTNLTFQTPVKTNFSFLQIFHHAKAKYKLLYKDDFICFSPEIFVKINAEGWIRSNPMKGTIDANIPDAKSLILNDLKEKSEHHTIVDLIRNDLSKVAKKVRVERFRYLDLITTNTKDLWQVSSEIIGELPENWKENIGTIFDTLLPAGSISGAPKSSTLQIINEAENYQRDFYTGIVGFFDGKTVNSGVMIRFLEKKGQDLFFKSGGGITVFSNAEKEYLELLQKIYVPIFRND
jgi:para-aminobenzoate synthetase component I